MLLFEFGATRISCTEYRKMKGFLLFIVIILLAVNEIAHCIHPKDIKKCHDDFRNCFTKCRNQQEIDSLDSNAIVHSIMEHCYKPCERTMRGCLAAHR